MWSYVILVIFTPAKQMQEPEVAEELEVCKHMNSKLLRLIYVLKFDNL